jgi:predicted glycosyltransferase
MADVWLDAVTPKDSLLIYSLLPVLREKGHKTLVTAKKQTQTTEILDLLKVDYICVGEYGETLKEKLTVEQRRTLDFIDLFDKRGFPKVLWTHGDVSAIRTAFGLKIPIVYANDTLHALHVAKLVCPLVNWLVAPAAFGKSWSRFGISKSRIVLYNGIEEVAWLQEGKFEEPKFLRELANKKPVVLFRNVEYKASYCKEIKLDVWKLLKNLAEIATVVYLPRYKGEKEKLKELSNIWTPPKTVLTAQLIPYIDMTVGSGGTICRETALMEIPTINFHFWDAISKYLHHNGLPIERLRDRRKIVHRTKEILQKKQNINRRMSSIEKIVNPIPLMVHYIEGFLD